MFLQRFSTSFLRSSRSSIKLSYSPIFYNSTETPKKSLYKILNVATDASADDIKKSYLDLAKKYHPDTAPSDTELAVMRVNIEEKFKDINEAYRTLSNVKKRQQYDLENGVITQQQASYTQADPEFKNEDVYSNWAENRSKSKKGADALEDVDKFFNEKYYGGKVDEVNSRAGFKAFSDLEQKDVAGGSAFQILYDLRYALAGGFALFTVGTLGEIVYKKNKEKKKVSAMGTLREGKGLLTTLTPLNPV